ncbi:MAG TPA: RES family NAD+ phosphorylase [Flavisolibacter sp.]|nr:RES family NAD+ phosphorylase [Flavisolibacter sp.]
MFVYRIVKSKNRTDDLSGTGAYRFGGRWNHKGTYMLYTSENSSLAYLETLVHFDERDNPPNLYIMKIEIGTTAPVYSLKEKEYPAGWMQLELLENKELGSRLMQEKKFLAIRLKSAVNTAEYNYLLNPLFPRFYDLVKVVDVTPVKLDERLAK